LAFFASTLEEDQVGVLLQGFFFGPGRVQGVPSPLDGDQSIAFWWDHLAQQAKDLGAAGFTAIWLPPPLKGASGSSSNGYDPFDDYDLGAKDQKGTVPTRYGPREALQRCAAMMRANGIDVYADLVENQRDGDDGHFNFTYKDAFGNTGANPAGGRFSKSVIDFHPHVPEDPGVFSDQFSFGRDLAPINGGKPRGRCGEQLIASADWLTRALDLQGYRLDNTKGVSSIFVTELLHARSMANKFAVGEFADGNIQLLQNWANSVGHRSASFDFPLHFALKNMCNSPGGFPMFSLDHAGLAGVDPLGAVTFVENHDTDRGGVGGPIVQNKLLAYAYILTSEGYPCVFYRDYSKDPHCFGLKDEIDRLIWIHEKLASGPTLQRWKDNGVFAFERLGASHLLVGLNKDGGTTRTITVQTGFPANQELQNLIDDHAPRIKTDGRAVVTMTIPKNADGTGYVCYGLPAKIEPFKRNAIATTQDYEGAPDLDIKPAIGGERIQVCRVFADANTSMRIRLTPDTAHWTQTTSIQVAVNGPGGAAGSHTFTHNEAGASFLVQLREKGFHSLFVEGASTPAQNSAPRYVLSVTYTAPHSL
jgi:alpha-amylase